MRLVMEVLKKKRLAYHKSKTDNQTTTKQSQITSGGKAELFLSQMPNTGKTFLFCGTL